MSLADLSAGEVVIRVSHSDINYKDALAATGAGRILRRYPLVGGIDLAGVVESSADARFAPGDAVLVTGCSLSETHDGGYAQFARVPAEWVIPMPPGLDALTAMSLGTAGFTAALAIHRMEQNGQTPAGGPIAVSGATGGVGSIAVDMLSGRGYKVVAISGKSTAAEYLKALGATEVLSARGSTSAASRSRRRASPAPSTTWAARCSPGSRARWTSGATSPASGWPQDPTSRPPSCHSSCGAWRSSASTPPRPAASGASRCGSALPPTLRPRHLARIVTRTIDFDELPAAFPAYIEGKVTGRTVVRIA